MKKILCMLLTLALVFSLAMLSSCGKKKDPPKNDDDGIQTPIVDY